MTEIELRIETLKTNIELHKKTLAKGCKSEFHELNVKASLKKARRSLRRLEAEK
jgi:hypothetical protein